MMDQDRFDDFIGRAARDLDAPPPPPREAMWAAIEAARRDEAMADTPIAAVIPIPPSHTATPARAPQRYSAWLRYGAPLAAMLVLGIGLGRFVDLRDADVTTPPKQAAAPAPEVNATPDAQPPEATATQADPTLAALDRPPITSVAPDNSSPSLARSVRRGASTSRGAVVRGGTDAPAASTTPPSTTDAGGAMYQSTLPYQIVAKRHLSRTQALLVSMPADVRDGRINEVAVRAADLLVNTRLLLESPAANDPETRRLLDDLEPILAQVATISPTRTGEDVTMILNAINERSVLIRLHSATAGSRPSGT